ncbi:Alkaline phosphatase synthesis transcriptional regulatory protein PhoP [Enhygromyxa salina]|uniref:Alkaline phosphatase synthesis transcriptional regulatory protein PhoP n=1 Tax=Enhygromyxa salina TaxID=215803 RepID=A0A2S9YF44_9BACT|nr:Alkaline phosphatase synthesis transcriptional regulatory protein PhoP [Enhygromyxa salina]
MLVVDDEPFVCKIAERVLQREGFEVVTVTDGEQALTALAEHDDFALVLLDSSLPDMDAEGVLELMRARGFTTPVLLSSGYGADAVPKADEYPNIRGFLAKPYAVAALAARVRELLGLADP